MYDRELAAGFPCGDAGQDRLDAVCMVLIALGESCKNLQKVTGGELLSRYPQVDWKGVSGTRDILSHHYFDVDPQIVAAVCTKHIPGLKSALQSMLGDLSG